MAFWDLAYKSGWVTIEQLRIAVRTDDKPFGAITLEEFATITGESF